MFDRLSLGVSMPKLDLTLFVPHILAFLCVTGAACPDIIAMSFEIVCDLCLSVRGRIQPSSPAHEQTTQGLSRAHELPRQTKSYHKHMYYLDKPRAIMHMNYLDKPMSYHAH